MLLNKMCYNSRLYVISNMIQQSRRQMLKTCGSCFSKVMHFYEYLLARDVLGHAVRTFPVFQLKAYCSNIYTLAGVTKHPLSFVSLFSARYERLQGGSENVHTIIRGVNSGWAGWAIANPVFG